MKQSGHEQEAAGFGRRRHQARTAEAAQAGNQAAAETVLRDRRILGAARSDGDAEPGAKPAAAGQAFALVSFRLGLSHNNMNAMVGDLVDGKC